MSNRIPRQTGFTLLELLITLGMIGVLVGIGVPAMSDWTQRSQVRAETQRYLGVYNFARSTAISTNQVVTIRATQNADDSVDLDIYAGPNSPGNQAFNAGTDTYLRRLEGQANGLVIDTTPDTTYISFDQNGRFMGGGTLLVDIENKNANLGRRITINLSGRSAVSEI